jgi:hypothetical protein
MRGVRCTKDLKRQRSSILPPNHHAKMHLALNLQLRPADEYIDSTEDEQKKLLELTMALDCGRKKRGGMSLASVSKGSFSSIEYSGTEQHQLIPFHATDYITARLFDGIKNMPQFVQCLSLRNQNDMIILVHSSTY